MPARKRRNAGLPRDESAVNARTAKEVVGEDTRATMITFLQRQPVWIVLAVASGACAAFNGVFAKLYDQNIH